MGGDIAVPPEPRRNGDILAIRRRINQEYQGATHGAANAHGSPSGADGALDAQKGVGAGGGQVDGSADTLLAEPGDGRGGGLCLCAGGSYNVTRLTTSAIVPFRGCRK